MKAAVQVVALLLAAGITAFFWVLAAHAGKDADGVGLFALLSTVWLAVLVTNAATGGES